jgi:hypothetical protein
MAEKSTKIKDSDDIPKWAKVLEYTLESFGIFAKVMEVNLNEKNTEFCIEVAVGTKFQRVFDLEPEISAALLSPTGHVQISGPKPGTSFLSILVPSPAEQKHTKRANYEIVHVAKEVPVPAYSLAAMLRDGTTATLRIIGNFSHKLANKTEKIGQEN